MQTKTYHIILVLPVLLLAALSSCNKKLVEYNPGNGTADNVWSTPQGFVTNVNGAYSYIPFLYGNDENGLFLSEPGTDLWYRTVKIRKGARFAYALSVNDPLIFDGDAPMRAVTARIVSGNGHTANTRHLAAF